MSECCLQLDVGNSSAKWRLVDLSADSAHTVLARGRFNISSADGLTALQAAAGQAAHVWLSSVAASETNDRLIACLALSQAVVPWFAATTQRFGDLVNSYTDYSRMGVDRWLAMVAARARTRRRCCVVDAGSALTIDLVSEAGQHEGGYIIPGPALMERALLLDTDKVRFAEAPDYQLNPGTSTAEAVRHGIALAQAGAVELALKAARLDELSDEVLFTGGAGQMLAGLADCPGVYVQDLVLDGLQQVALADSSSRQ